ncbi:hypothetical protein EYF80_032395 [Liparis tanakae]|uniref:Uncharacterized protein n=1 Tax=Liparis tanakae TaxID=230148 RepID=A0A4Z2GV53_9TELE|nr:hypothetical protein EYF80_032395 [Liparis tanakae]
MKTLQRLVGFSHIKWKWTPARPRGLPVVHMMAPAHRTEPFLMITEVKTQTLDPRSGSPKTQTLDPGGL